MSKYIIDIPKTVGMLGTAGSVHYTYFDGIQVQTIVLKGDEIEELNADYINEHFGDLQDDAYNKGYAQCQDDYSDALKHAKDTAYQKGFEDGKWKSEDGCTGCKYEGKTGEHLPCDYCMNNFKNQWTAKDDKIEVGDEVIYNGTTKCVVVTPETDEEYASLFDCNGIHYSADHRECKKTGRHFDIDKILEEMRND